MKEKHPASTRTKKDRVTPPARQPHREQVISMAMVRLLSGREAGAMLSEALESTRQATMNVVQRAAPRLLKQIRP